MNNFKLIFPAGYVVSDVLNDNLDINVITEDGKIYFATIFTLQNIHNLMMKESIQFFWADDMVIVRDLEKSTIKKAISELIAEGYITSALSQIAEIGLGMAKKVIYSEIVDLSDRIENYGLDE